MLYTVRTYCPECLAQFLVDQEAVDKEDARKKVVGRSVTCPQLHEFPVEDYFIIGVYPSPERVPIPPYKTHPLNHGKPPSWQLGAVVVEEIPLPIGSDPTGSPYLKKTVRDSFTDFIYEQTVQSFALRFLKPYPELSIGGIKYGPYHPGDIDSIPLRAKAKELVDMEVAEWAYPEFEAHIQYHRDIFTKFLEEARKMREANKIDEAILYLVSHSPDITVQTIADALDLGYWTTYRHITALMGREAKPILEEAREAGLERWLPEIEAAERLGEEPKVTVTGKWRGKFTFGPIKRPTEEELLAELKRIMTLELGRLPTLREFAPIKKALRRKKRSELQQQIVSWMEGS